MPKKFLFIFLLAIIFCLPFIAFGLELQLRYPRITLPGIGTLEITTTTPLHDLARYIYYLFVILGAVIAFIGLILGGIKWLSSTGDPKAISEAKKQILVSFLGIILILFSWLILYTIDPQLVIFYRFSPSAPSYPPPILAKPEITDGIIFYTNREDIPEIAVPYGSIYVDDTRRFPLRRTSIDLDGLTNQGAFRLGEDRITHIKIINPKNPDFPKCLPNCGPFKYTYGVACFNDPDFRGQVKIYRQDEESKKECFGIPWLVPAACGVVLGSNSLTCCQWTAPCGSVLVFRVPAQNLRVHNLLTDKIIFYEKPYPDREEKVPVPLPGVPPKRKIIGDCFKINLTNEERCSRFSPFPLDLTDPFEVRVGCFCEGEVDNLETEVKDPNTGQVLRTWLPLSMEIEPDGKYLVFLFQISGKKEKWTWDRGNAYWFTTDVENFANKEDKRLYWNYVPNPVDDKIKISPASAIIFQVEEIF